MLIKIKGALAEEHLAKLAITMLTKHAGVAAGSAKALLDGFGYKNHRRKKTL